MKIIRTLAPLSTSLFFAFGGCAHLEIASFPAIAAGFDSHQICSALFVSGLEEEVTYRQMIAPTYGPVKQFFHHSVDYQEKTVTSRFGNARSEQAVYRDGEGCLVLHGAPPPPPAKVNTDPSLNLIGSIAGAQIVAPINAALDEAVNHAFEENTTGPRRNTKAVIIVHNGRIIAEKYAPNYGINTVQPGWSISKSITNALIGILVRQGQLSIDSNVQLGNWANAENPHHEITIDNLLRMTSGTNFGRSDRADPTSGIDPTSRMVFAERDMTAYALTAKAKYKAGQKWRYSNGNTILLSRIIRDMTGGNAQGVVDFAYRELFDKLGMENVTMEFDATGTPLGSSHFYASARDFARFGLLYLNDGIIGGERILPDGWTDYSARPTSAALDDGYGAGFWTGRGAGRAHDWYMAHGLPEDFYYASGVYGQKILILPKDNIVIVRLGAAFTPMGDMEATARLTKETRAALGLN